MRQLSIREIDRRVDQTVGVFAIVAGASGLMADQWPAIASVLIAILVAASFVLLAYVEPTFRPGNWQRDEADSVPVIGRSQKA